MKVLELLYGNRANALRSLLAFCIISAYIYVSLRMWVRCRITKAFGADDLFLLATLASFSIYTTTSLYGIRDGIGSAPDDIDDGSRLSTALRHWFLSELLYIVTTALLRIAACIHLRNISKTSGQKQLIFCILTLTLLSNGTYFLFSMQQCTPVQYFWTGWLGEVGSCVDEHKAASLTYVFSLISGLSDASLTLLPICLFWGEDMNERMRGGRNIIMGLGLLAGTAALFRIPSTKNLLTSFDFFFDCVPVAISSVLEPALGIIALSAAALAPLDLNTQMRGNMRVLHTRADFKTPIIHEKGMVVPALPSLPPRAVVRRPASGVGE